VTARKETFVLHVALFSKRGKAEREREKERERERERDIVTKDLSCV